MMSDEEFLAYCESHSETERALFCGSQVARLLRLAGDPGDNAEEWELHRAERWFSVDLSDLCKLARKRGMNGHNDN